MHKVVAQMSLQIIKKRILYSTVGKRIAYDFFVSLVTLFVVFFTFNVFNQYISGGESIFIFPLLFTSFNYLFGLYSQFKMSPIFVKASLILISGFLTTIVLAILHLFFLPFAIGVIFILALTILPRIFFNIYSQKNYHKLFNSFVQDGAPILVVGGGGYIGSVLVEKLLQIGYKVRVFDKFIYGKSVLKDLMKNKQLEIIEGDISDLYQLTRALNNVQAVVHLAAIVGDPAASLDEKLTRHVNIISTRMLKETVKAFNIPRFIFASSCSLYGATDSEANENSPLNPLSLYASTKIDAEQELLLDTYDDFHPTILRFGTVFGHSRRPRFDLVANLFVAQAFTNGIITVTNGMQYRPFIHVRDVANAIIKVLEADQDKVSRQIFNVGDNELNVTISDMAKTVKRIVSKDKKVKIKIDKRDLDRRNYRVSFNKINKILEFKAEKSLEEGLKELYANFKNGTYNKRYDDPSYSNYEMTKEMRKEFHTNKYGEQHYSLISQ